MNKDQWSGSWKQLKGKVRETWANLTDDDLAALEANKDQLAGKIQERYGIAKEDAQRQIEDFERKNSDYFDRN